MGLYDDSINMLKSHYCGRNLSPMILIGKYYTHEIREYFSFAFYPILRFGYTYEEFILQLSFKTRSTSASCLLKGYDTKPAAITYKMVYCFMAAILKTGILFEDWNRESTWPGTAGKLEK